MKIAVLSNINVDPLASALKKNGFNDMYLAGFNQFMMELLDPSYSLSQDETDIVLLHLDGDELVKNTTNVEELENTDFSDLFSILVQFAEKFPAKTICVSGVVISPLNYLSHLNGNSRHSFSSIQNAFNTRLQELSLSASNVYYLDFPAIVSYYGIQALYDNKFWYLGRIKYTNLAFKQLASSTKSLVCAVKGKTKKVLVLDLDNTLWGGVIGEDGMQGIDLSEDGIGKVFRDFQRNIVRLKSIGIILAICSKNNEDDALEVFKSHPMMYLKKEDFVSIKINWKDKASNIQEIAQELDLNLDSFVFIDDNPVEREIVKQNLPAVEVPEFPDDITSLNNWFISEVVFAFFPKVSLTKEDTEKTKQYERNAQRKSLQTSLNIADYIKSLQINTTLLVNDTTFISRLAQLTQKTNQFNLTTRRYTDSDIEVLMKNHDTVVFGYQYSDKFGNEGVIAEAIVRKVGCDAVIDVFLMSCRVIGRNVEYRFMLDLLNATVDRWEIPSIKAEYIQTSKNELAKKFYVNCGFKSTDGEHFHSKIDDLKAFLEKLILQ